MFDVWPGHLVEIAEAADLWGHGPAVDCESTVDFAHQGQDVDRSTATDAGLDLSLKEKAELRALIEAVQSLQSPSQGLLATMMVEAVLRLVGDIVGRAPIDEDLLLQRANALAALVVEATDPVLAAHPDDLALLHSFKIDVRAIFDPALARGTLQLRIGAEVVEDGVEPALRRLHEAIDTMGIGS